MGTIGRNPETGNLELRDDDGNLIEPNPEHLADLLRDEYCKEFGFDGPPRTPEELQAQMQTIRENKLRAEAETAEELARIEAEYKARKQAEEDHRRRYEEAVIKLAEQAEDDANSQCKESKPGRKPTVNARMLDVLTRNHLARGWTARQWAGELRCSPSSISDTPTWKELQASRDLLKAEHATTKRRRRK